MIEPIIKIPIYRFLFSKIQLTRLKKKIFFQLFHILRRSSVYEF